MLSWKKRKKGEEISSKILSLFNYLDASTDDRVEKKKEKKLLFHDCNFISRKLRMESRCVFFFLFFYIQRYHLHDYPSIFPRSRVKTLIFPCHSGCSLRNTWFSNSGHNRFLSSNTRRISRQERFVSDTVLLPFVTRRFDERKGYSSLFLPSFFFFPLNSSLPRILSSLFSLVPFFFSLFFFYPPREYFHHSGGVQCWGCTQWELNSTSFSLPSTKIRRDSRRYRAHNGEGICNIEATMNRNAPRCPIARFCGNPIYLHFPFTNCTPLTPGGWLVARRFSSPLDRDKNL